MTNQKIIIFGAGRIGRSFIGQLFSKGGFEVVFVDISLPVIHELNRRRKYDVIIKSKVDKKITVSNVRGVDARNEGDVAEEISDARIMAVSVGINALSGIMPLIAVGLKERYKRSVIDAIDIIIAENMRDGARYFREELSKYLPHDYPLEKLVGLVETSIGKMVPIIPENIMKKDILKVFAEPYNTLILDKSAFKNPIPDVEGLSPKDNMKAWVDRKLFIHNLGHAATAYWGFFYNQHFKHIWEALEVPRIYSTVRATMKQSAKLLEKKYPEDFSISELDHHINDLLQRFSNQALGDTIYRVGCDLPRKLGPHDRLAGAIKLALSMDMPYDKILKALIAGCHFRAKSEKGYMYPADVEFVKTYEKGISEVLINISGFDKNNYPRIFTEAEEIENKLHLLKIF
jgi:mannitol-1-phosphate 5-dehydrogenase